RRSMMADSSGERTRLACWRWRPRHRESFRIAHTSRALVSASRRNGLFPPSCSRCRRHRLLHNKFAKIQTGVTDRRYSKTGRRARAAVVLIVSALAWLLARSIAGWLSTIVWCALLVVPAFLRNRAWAARYHYRQSGSNRPSGLGRQFGITVSPVVLALIIVNVAVFVLELLG